MIVTRHAGVTRFQEIISTRILSRRVITMQYQYQFTIKEKGLRTLASGLP